MKKKEATKLPRKIRWMQRLFAIGGNIAPGVMMKLMLKFLFTPKRQILKPPHLECLESAKKITVAVPVYKKPKYRLKLSCYEWGSGEKLILIVHGWDAKALDFYKMIPELVNHGFRVVAFDGPAHGQSEGELTSMIHFKEILPDIIATIGKPFGIVAHSMGAAASSHLLIESDISVERFVQLTMPLNPEHFFETVFKFMKVPRKLQRLFMIEIEKVSGESIKNYNLLERKGKMKVDKVLNIYEEHDDEVPLDHVAIYLKKHPDFSSIKVSGVGHNRVMKDKNVIEAVVKFLE
jgi:hypothetical protein